MTDNKKTSQLKEKSSKLDRYQEDRHNENARTASALEPVTPRINTDHL